MLDAGWITEHNGSMVLCFLKQLGRCVVLGRENKLDCNTSLCPVCATTTRSFVFLLTGAIVVLLLRTTGGGREHSTEQRSTHYVISSRRQRAAGFPDVTSLPFHTRSTELMKRLLSLFTINVHTYLCVVGLSQGFRQCLLTANTAFLLVVWASTTKAEP